MPNHYHQLGVDKHASTQTITKAYKGLALIHHPDRPSGNPEKFRVIDTAYKILINPNTRREYDLFSLGNFNGHRKRLAQQGLSYSLLEDPNQYDHYTYLNKLFNLQEDKQFLIGQAIVNHDTLWEQLDYVQGLIQTEDCRLERVPKPTQEMKEQRRKIDLNSKKMGAMADVFGNRKKLLYDLSLDTVVHSDEMKEIERLIGGRARLIEYIKKDQKIFISTPIFTLRKINALNPSNFIQLTQCTKHELLSLLFTLKDLLSTHLLTQLSFDRVIHQKKWALEISKGVTCLKKYNLLNQKYFNIIVNAGKYAETVAFNLGDLKLFSILNEANEQIVIEKIRGLIWFPLDTMKRADLLTQKQSDALLWKGPEELDSLNSCIDQMAAHSLFLLDYDKEEGKTALLLALALKQDLKEFFENPLEERTRMKHAFREAFIMKLHSKDKEMSFHRTPWKNIIANILIAFTGIGLFALGAYYLRNRQCFFAQTTREKQIAAVEKETLTDIFLV